MNPEIATYRVRNEKGEIVDKKIEYDADAPCISCGLPVIEASMGGTVLCPWCDVGHDRKGNERQIWPIHYPHPKFVEHYARKADITQEEWLKQYRDSGQRTRGWPEEEK